jgi:hypothetical protein
LRKVREQQHVANIRRVRQDHDQAIDADTAATGRRHAVFQRADVVGVVVHRLFIAGVLGLDLRQETRRLVFRIVQLREAVGDLAAHHEQLEALGDAFAGVRSARQRRHFDRVVDDEGRLPQLRFGGLFEQRQLQRAQAGGGEAA